MLTTEVDTKIDVKTPYFNTERINLNDQNLATLFLFQVYRERCSTLHQLMYVKSNHCVNFKHCCYLLQGNREKRPDCVLCHFMLRSF